MHILGQAYLTSYCWPNSALIDDLLHPDVRSLTDWQQLWYNVICKCCNRKSKGIIHGTCTPLDPGTYILCLCFDSIATIYRFGNITRSLVFVSEVEQTIVPAPWFEKSWRFDVTVTVLMLTNARSIPSQWSSLNLYIYRVRIEVQLRLY